MAPEHSTLPATLEGRWVKYLQYVLHFSDPPCRLESMPVVTHKCVIKKMLRNNGSYGYGPRALAIYQYHIGVDGPTRWFVAFSASDVSEMQQEIGNVQLLWSRTQGGRNGT